ncbi:hypothetical protein ACTFIV_004203 [Dictyostelium citrinum]
MEQKPDFLDKIKLFLKKINVDYIEIKEIIHQRIHDDINQYMIEIIFKIRKSEFPIKSNYSDFKGVSEHDCLTEIKNYFKCQPNYVPTRTKKVKKFLKKYKEIFIICLLILCGILIGVFEKNLLVLITSIIIAILLLFTIIILINKYEDKELIICLSNAVNVRYDLSYDSYRLPRKFVRDKEYLIDLSNGKKEINVLAPDEILKLAQKDIILNLVRFYGDSNEQKTFIIKNEDAFRMRYINGIRMASMKIIKEDGITLIYSSDNILESSFKDYNIGTIKVLSKHGYHFFPTSFVGRTKIKV